jgi:hypothetical protein
MERKLQPKPDAAGAERAPRAAAPATSTEHILDLQRSAGNHAVTGMLAREEKAAESNKSVDIKGLGVVPILSYQIGRTAPPSGTAGSAKPDIDPKQVVFSSAQGEHSPKLMQAVAKGEPFELAVIQTGGPQVTLKGGVMASNYFVSGADGPTSTESWTLVADKVSFGS